jgi:hypothetical protein
MEMLDSQPDLQKLGPSPGNLVKSGRKWGDACYHLKCVIHNLPRSISAPPAGLPEGGGTIEPLFLVSVNVSRE